MTVVVTSEKFIHGPRFRAETVHPKVGKFWQTVFASVRPVQYLASPAVQHFPVDQPNQSFPTLIDIANVSARRDKTDGIGLEETFTQHLIACERDSNGFQENLYVTYLHKHSPEHSARLP